jgi:hypothetical protein
MLVDSLVTGAAYQDNISKMAQAAGSTRQLLEGASASFALSSSMTAALTRWAEIQPEAGRFYFPEYEGLKTLSLRMAEIDTVLEGFRSATAGISSNVAGLIQGVDALALSSRTIWDGFPFGSGYRHPWVVEAPIVQPYEAARNVSQIAALEQDEELDVPEEVQPSIAPGSEVVRRLRARGAPFADLLLAARDVVEAERTDYVRHASVSLRELLDKLLDDLAPATEVTSWTPSAQLYQDGQTNKARLLYVFRDVNAEAYTVFAEKDIEHILQTFFALNQGTHRLKSPFGRRVMQSLIARVEGHLMLLLTVANEE